jgi:hypothetical protein
MDTLASSISGAPFSPAVQAKQGQGRADVLFHAVFLLQIF